MPLDHERRVFCFIGPLLKEFRWRSGTGSMLTSDNAPNVRGMPISRRARSERWIGSRLNSTRQLHTGLRLGMAGR